MSAMCSVLKGNGPELRACAQAINRAAPGKTIHISLDVAGIAVQKTPHSKGSVVVLCTDADGQVLAEYRHDIVKPKAGFQRVEIADVVIPPDTVETHLMLLVEVYEVATDGDWWRFDNINIQVF